MVAETASSGDDFTRTLGEVKHLGSLSSQPHLVSIRYSKGAIQFNPDTGADVTIVDDATFSRLRARPPLVRSNVKLMAYGSKMPLNIHRFYRTSLTYQDKTVAEQIFVSNDQNKGVSLLSRSLGARNTSLWYAGGAAVALDRGWLFGASLAFGFSGYLQRSWLSQRPGYLTSA